MKLSEKAIGVIERIATHLAKQRAKAESGPNKCEYRSRNGNACAVGCLIPDELYTRSLEGSTIDKIFNGRVKEHGGVWSELSRMFENEDEAILVLSHAQRYHDDNHGSIYGYSSALRTFPSKDDNELTQIIKERIITKIEMGGHEV